MNESVTVAKEADAKKASSSTHKSDERIHRAHNESERQLGSLGAVVGNIKSNGGTLSADSIATQLSSMHTTQRAPALLALQKTRQPVCVAGGLRNSGEACGGAAR